MGLTRLETDELWISKPALDNRAKETLAYLQTQNLKGKRLADCGEYNPMARRIENLLDREIETLDWDFDRNFGTQYGKYDVIFCFEVLEHLFNPLFFLQVLKYHLESGGIIYLSTPRQWPQCIKAIHHYHEIPTDRLMWLFDAAGLQVEEMVKITIAGNWYNHLYGIRPILRYFQKTRLYKLRVLEEETISVG